MTFGAPEVFPGLSLGRGRFWRGIEDIVEAFTPAILDQATPSWPRAI